MIDDMLAEKPLGWMEDEPELVPDEETVKPSDW
jgi:Calreticulin family